MATNFGGITHFLFYKYIDIGSWALYPAMCLILFENTVSYCHTVQGDFLCKKHLLQRNTFFLIFDEKVKNELNTSKQKIIMHNVQINNIHILKIMVLNFFVVINEKYTVYLQYYNKNVKIHFV